MLVDPVPWGILVCGWGFISDHTMVVYSTVTDYVAAVMGAKPLASQWWKGGLGLSSDSIVLMGLR